MAKLNIWIYVLLVWVNIHVSSGQCADYRTPSIYFLHIQSDIKYRFATTLVTSKVVNPSRLSKEVVFDVTLPDKAYISDFLMEIDGKIYPGRVDEKEKSRKQYRQAKKKGQSAGQVSQRPRETNRFKTEVNVAAKSNVTFKLTYQELLYRNLGSYEHVIYIQPGQIVHDMRIDVSIQESRDITNLNVPPLRNDILVDETNVTERNELAVIERPTSKSARIRYYPSVEDQRARFEQGINGLFVVEYDIARQMDAGDVLVVDGYFVHFFAPQGMNPIPKNVLFILDVSGSMKGTKIQQLRDAMMRILNDLHEDDMFNIMTFSTNNQFLIPYGKVLPATRDLLFYARKYVQNIFPGGGTNINEALVSGLLFLNGLYFINKLDREPVLVFLTDGLANTGETNIDNILANVKHTNTEQIPVFSLAFGTGADYEFVKKVAVQNFGMGRKIYEDSDAELQIAGFYDEISTTILQNVTFKYLDDSVDTQKLTQSNFNSFFDGSELIVAGKIEDITINVLKLAVFGNGAKGKLELVFNIDVTSQPDLTKPNDYAQITEKIWAYLTIKQLLEQSVGETNSLKRERMKEKALDLSLKYKFVTPLTSMVVTKPDEQEVVGDLEEGDDAKLYREGQSARGRKIHHSPGFTVKKRMMEAVPRSQGGFITRKRGPGPVENVESSSRNKKGDEKTFIGYIVVISIILHYSLTQFAFG